VGFHPDDGTGNGRIHGMLSIETEPELGTSYVTTIA
jgi:hypothetical protein